MNHWSFDADICREFFARTEKLTQAQIDWLVIRNGVPADALGRDLFGGAVLGSAKVELAGKRFEFREDGASAIAVVARDVDGAAADIVAWEPRAKWFAPWLGAVPLLGMQALGEPRMGEPLPVFLTFMSWLLGGRDGCLIIDRRRAWRLLEGMKIRAESIEAGLELRRILSRPEPRIVVEASAVEQRAAA